MEERLASYVRFDQGDCALVEGKKGLYHVTDVTITNRDSEGVPARGDADHG